MKLIFNGEVSESGKLKIFKRKEFESEMLMFAGKKVILTVEKKTRKRSLCQNSFYWGVVVPMVRAGLLDTGYKLSLEQTHDLLKMMFLEKEIVNEKTGEILKSIKSTTELTTTDFMVFIDDVQRWASEYLSIVIPSPGEQIEIEL